MKTPDPQLRQQLDAKSKKYSDAMNNNDAVWSLEFSKSVRAGLIGITFDFNADWQAVHSSRDADLSVDRRDGDVEPSFLDLLNLIVAADASQPLGTRLDAPLLRFAIDGNQTELWTVTE